MLSGKQKRYLRSLGTVMEPVVFVGKASLTAAIVKSAKEALDAHELVKVRVLQNCALLPCAALADLARATGSELAQVIGRNGLLYLRNAENPKIQLP